MVNPATMRFCGMCGARLTPHPLGRERRRVTVVFIDLVGFSALTKDFDPEKMRDLADEILTVIAGLIEDFDGYVDAFQGDGLIALFGAPHSHPDDAERAVLAAAAGLRAVESIGQNKGLTLKGRAGINTGTVIAGTVGTGRVRDYTVMGAAVNLAARLEAAASPGEVWVGEETFEATRHRLYYAPSPLLKLRGFPEVTRAYHFTERMHARDPYAHLSFVGRNHERGVLRHALDEVRRTGEIKEVRLVGKAGSGKTRLLREFCKEVKRQRSAQVVWLEPNTFSALPLEPLLLSDGLQDKPLLLIAEPSAVQEALLLERSAAGALVVRLSRKEVRSASTQTLQLTPLNNEESLALLAQLTRPEYKLAAEALVTQVGGVPAHVIELGRALGAAQFGTLPNSLTSLLQARLDLLPQSARQLLAQLALVGERCWAGLAVDLMSPGDLDTLLAEDLLVLEAHTALSGETEYRFQSELLRSAALLMVPFSERPQTHRRIARWLAAHTAEDGQIIQNAKLATLIAYHFKQAGDDAAAHPFLLGAALVAAQKGDHKPLESLLTLELPSPLRAQSLLAHVQATWQRDAETALRYLEEVRHWLDLQLEGEYIDLRAECGRLESHLTEIKAETEEVEITEQTNTLRIAS